MRPFERIGCRGVSGEVSVKTRGFQTQEEFVLIFMEETEENDYGVRREFNLYKSGCTRLVVNIFP